jgi:hypothetical protein
MGLLQSLFYYSYKCVNYPHLSKYEYKSLSEIKGVLFWPDKPVEINRGCGTSVTTYETCVKNPF